MYNETYHPVNEETLRWMLVEESEENKKAITERVAKAINTKERSYVIELPDGGNYVITNGIVQGSKHIYNK